MKKTKIDKHLSAVAFIMESMQTMRIHLLRFPTKRNMLLAQCLEDGKEAMKVKFLKATLEDK
jgi:hypothetical protein